AMLSTGSTCRAVATRGLGAWRARSPPSPAPRPCVPSTSPRRSRTARRTSSAMSELALAVFASETGTHLVRPPTGARWAEFRRRFDEKAYLAELGGCGFRFVARSAPEFPLLLRAIHDPPAGLFVRGNADFGLLAQPAVAVVGARACSGYGS